MQYFINYEVLDKYKSRLYLSSIRLNFFKKFVDSDFKVRSEEYSVYIRLHAPSCSLPQTLHSPFPKPGFWKVSV